MSDLDNASEPVESVPSPNADRAKQIFARLEREELVALSEPANRESLYAGLASVLDNCGDLEELGTAVADWLMGRHDVADVFGTDEQLAAVCVPN